MLAGMWNLKLSDPAATHALGVALGQVAREGDVVALIGDLGAGKTSLAQGVGEGLAVFEDVVSPTFNLVVEHEGRIPLLHADVYRLDAHELDAIGLEEQLEQWPGLVLVEWADRFPGLIPVDHVACRLQFMAGGGRRAQIAAAGAGRELLARWQAGFNAATG
ncbi:MAG: tRNA (adenosine(37)-N6)-threonylcarbamoyltransferase complex ATPase subunit type 1 TsaE [Myxococcota bacterium]|nr:tRNA (adenosine(37)-N6)-threonylcarbamoyltransferase complex ATPase subunit type 1 TsaE [Myxococcota bacterium]MEC8423351.1 tRNA (adenosine(37)-N6)-threonylcarbamoyltransferase complex ATPase subunit type 1 TsaE [Myxococcota bacterium]